MKNDILKMILLAIFFLFFGKKRKKKKRKRKEKFFFFLKAMISRVLKNKWKTSEKKEEQNGSDDFRQIKVCKNLIGEKLTVRTVTNHKASTVVLPIGPYLYTIFLL